MIAENRNCVASEGRMTRNGSVDREKERGMIDAEVFTADGESANEGNGDREH